MALEEVASVGDTFDATAYAWLREFGAGIYRKNFIDLHLAVA